MKFQRIACIALVAIPMGRSMHAQETSAKSDPRLEGLEAFEARVHESEGGKLNYRLLKPLDFDKQSDKSVKYPLVLFLHGAGERGSENLRQLIHGGKNFANEDFRRRYGAFIVVPQSPADKKWVEVPWDAKEHVAPEDAGETMNLVFSLLEELQEEFPVDDARIYGVGLSMGGYGTWDILGRKPGLLAAAAPICGGGDPAQAPMMKDTPIWAFHGGADPVVVPERSRKMVDAIRAAGGEPIYTEYEGVGHDSWTETFNNRLLWDWLFAQRRNP